MITIIYIFRVIILVLTMLIVLPLLSVSINDEANSFTSMVAFNMLKEIPNNSADYSVILIIRLILYITC